MFVGFVFAVFCVGEISLASPQEVCRNDSHERAPTDGRARADGDCFKRVQSAGSWSNLPSDVRSAFRNGNDRGVRGEGRGFRVARELP